MNATTAPRTRSHGFTDAPETAGASAPAASKPSTAMQPEHTASNWTAYGDADNADRFTPSAQITGRKKWRYEAGGRQSIVIAAGGHSFMRARLGDSVIAFALPKP
jgi:glucose dehydrogenase